MSDIFDEVDEILNEVDGDSGGDSKVSAPVETESNFNESELMDIMAEIENLEKEFDTVAPVEEASEMEAMLGSEMDSAEDSDMETESLLEELDELEEAEAISVASEAAVAAIAPAPASMPTPSMSKTELQKEIDRELEMTLQGAFDEASEVVAPISSPSILAFEKKATVAPATTPSSSEISFEAQGQMTLNLGFKIGEETATLSIDPVKGLIVTMKGVNLCINQEEGCQVTMENGVTFTIPLTSATSALKKKSA